MNSLLFFFALRCIVYYLVDVVSSPREARRRAAALSVEFTPRRRHLIHEPGLFHCSARVAAPSHKRQRLISPVSLTSTGRRPSGTSGF